MEKKPNVFQNFYSRPNLKINLDSLNKKKSIALPPANPLIERQVIPIQQPKFGKNISIIDKIFAKISKLFK